MIDGKRLTWIFSSLALVTAFVLGSYYLGHGLGEQLGERQANTDAYARHAQDEINKTCSTLIGVAQMECIARVIETTNEHERAEYDLSAQRNMDRWAALMLVATVLMTIVTALGVYFVWRTLTATRTMAEDTREIGEAQVRAYAFATDFIIQNENNSIGLKIQNFGNSPCDVQFIDCTIVVFDPYKSKKLWSQKFWSDGFQISPQGEVTETFYLDVGRSKYISEAIERDGISVCLQGHFKYSDVFKAVHSQPIDITKSDGVRN